MKKETPYLDFYKNYADKQMPGGLGLCLLFGFSDELDLFAPEGRYFTYWGALDDDPCKGYCNEFRQTVILLCAAMNSEL